MERKDRDNIAMAIANELLDNEILDENNFSYDTDALLQCPYRRIFILGSMKIRRYGLFHE